MVNRMPPAEIWDRIEKASVGDTSASSQPDYIPLPSLDADSERNEDQQEASSSLNGFQQQQGPSIPTKRKCLISGEVTTTTTPWRTMEYTCDPPGLHQEICDFYEYMRPRPSELQMRSEVILRTMTIILNRWPQAKIQVFGSFCTALFLPTGDIDLVVQGNWPSTPLFTLEEDLKLYDVALEDSILVIDKTVVPVIKFIDKLTEVRLDIHFNEESGIKSARQIQQFIQEYPFLPKLVFVLKQFLYEQNLHEVYYGGISSYSLILLLVSFLQLHPRQAATESNPNLGVLLMEFLELYGRNFNYMKTAITVLNGGSYLPKEDLPETPGKNSLLYVVDPSNPNENAASGCFGLWQVKQAFDYAFSRLHTSVLSRENPIPKRESLLSDIMKVTKEVEEYRNWVDKNWTAPLTTMPPYCFFPPHHPSAGLPPYLPHQQYISPHSHPTALEQLSAPANTPTGSNSTPSKPSPNVQERPTSSN